MKVSLCEFQVRMMLGVSPQDGAHTSVLAGDYLLLHLFMHLLLHLLLHFDTLPSGTFSGLLQSSSTAAAPDKHACKCNGMQAAG